MNTKRINKITILGDGGWGTTLAILLSKKGYDVCLWGVFKDYVEFLKKRKENVRFLKGIQIPAQIFITSNLKQACDFSGTIILAIPSQYLRGILKSIKDYHRKNKIFLSATKGIENKTLMRMSEVIFDELGKVDLAVLSGPNISQEIARSLPAVSVAASQDLKMAEYFQVLLMSERFRVYTNEDVVGVELGGSLKNIIALACGISDGLGFGSNAKAALLTRGLVEISRLGVAMGAKRETFFGASGLGDLVTTCVSAYSRNRFVGEQIAKGKTLNTIMKKMQMPACSPRSTRVEAGRQAGLPTGQAGIAEGVLTTKAAYQLSKRYNVEMPITKEIYLVLYKNKSPKEAVKDLMLRDKKPEV